MLGPVYRYLHSKVGHRWDDVFSELSRELGAKSHPMRHILYQHILSGSGRFRTPSDSPLDLWARGWEFYVDEHGLVQKRLNSRRRNRTKPGPPRRIESGDGRWFVEIEGIWYLGTYSLREACGPDAHHTHTHDPNRPLRTESPVVWPDFRNGRNGPVNVFTKLKQANKKELRLKDSLLAPNATLRHHRASAGPVISARR